MYNNQLQLTASIRGTCDKVSLGAEQMTILTHIQLSDEGSHVVVFEVQRKNLLSELGLIVYDEALSFLERGTGQKLTNEYSFYQL